MSLHPAPLQPASEAVDWQGTAHYEVVRRLGQGGMGVVYEAWDRERGQPVALKTLLHVTPAALYMFKQEFRTLADVNHPNLVRLHELVVTESDRVFFAMELVRGTDFLTHVQKPTMPPSSGSELGLRPSPAAFDRLRHALRQLVEGVMALHGARKLHRDIKPSNVLVTEEGRVVLLDFGVATELARVVDEEMREQADAVGTARYAAPEQAFEEAGPACDWYSVGVILYEAIVGRPPFVGSAIDVLTMKNTVDPLPPSGCVANVPVDLDALSCALLHREPAMRPSGAEILRRLGVTVSGPPGRSESAIAPASDAATHVGLAGRETHLRALHDAFETARSGATVVVRVGGRAGMGKSSLVHRFLDELVERGTAVVLRGRAYEREAVPYKAVDTVIDALSRYLMCLSDEDLTVALPKDMWALTRLFPVLRRVPAIGTLAEEPVSDPQRVRRRAFLALRELLASLARRRPIVMFVDDAQWGDTDSAALLLDLLRPPHAPPLLLAMTYREEEASTSPFLRELSAHWYEATDVRDLPVGPLDHADGRHLALTLLGSGGESVEEIADIIARESGGSPFLVEELARSRGLQARDMSAQDASVALASVTLEQMVSDRLAALPDEARRLLEIVAVGGRPLTVSLASQAAGIAGIQGAADEMISLLRTRRFLRAGLRDGREVLEAVHARIRETIVAQLDAVSVREHHGRLARVLEVTPDVDVEALATHLLGAGETERGAQFAERAAEQAAGKLAFDQAARLLRLTLETLPASSPDRRRLRKRLGEVLEWAGRSAEAGQVYLEAAEGAPALEKVDLQRAAAEQFHASGRMEEGTQVLHQVLAAVGVKAPRSGRSALFWLIAYHLWLRVMGLRFRERDADQVRPEDRLRIDALYAAALGFSLVDHVLGVSMKVRTLVASLRAGDRLQVSRAACMVALDLGGNGGPEGRTERKLWALAWRLAERLADKEKNHVAKFAVRATAGITLFLRGRWREAKDTLDPVQAMTTNRRVGQQSAALFHLYALHFLGDLKELTQRYTRVLAEAEERGNLFMSVNLRTSTAAPVWLAADDPARARRELNEAMAQWSPGKFTTQEWRGILFGADIDLYVGDAASAYEHVKGLAHDLKESSFLFVQYVRALTAFVQGRAAIATLDGLPAPLRRARLAEIRRLQRRLDREQMAWIAALAAILRAGSASAAGDRSGAVAALRLAIERAQASEMALYAASAQHQLGLLLGGSEGAKLVGEAEDAMAARGVRAPARFAAMLVPGRWGPPEN